MASRIQGITVEIGGNTTKLQNALKDVNGQIKSTQSQLKDVNKLLKLDPGNTELLAQKHKLLAEAASETKEKLATLKTAAGQDYKNLDEFFSHTKKSFRNLIREDEQKQMESSIWKQIDGGNENDYIYFHMRKSDGSYISVLDHGRIVETPQYGRAFYVMFIDWEDKK